MNLVVDIGNSLIKIFVFDNNTIIHNSQFEENHVNIEINKIFKTYVKLENAIISSVKDIDNEIIQILERKIKNIILLNENTKIPIKNLYKSPKTLGKDRLAAVVGANNIFPNNDVLAIDAGTAITFDYINKKNEYIGGNISPGLEMRFKALNYFTSKLPLIKKNEKYKLIGQNTEEAIIAGVQNGLIFEIDSYIDSFKKKNKHIKIILTGGDCFFFEHKLKNRIFAELFLVSIGLNQILKYNVKNI
ncbi:MAG: type III pantothenate kinase [Bacteroidales bacterium]|nr:type III pantothenate kinase [Bacteroidales bacterium]MBN2757853.1 type III pantothenate kinase [Bacteroidales bacterium]